MGHFFWDTLYIFSSPFRKRILHKYKSDNYYLCPLLKGKMGKSAMKILGMKDEEFYEVGGWC